MSKKVCPPKKTSSALGNDAETKREHDNEWRDSRSSAQCLSYLCLSEELSDVRLTFSDDESIKLPVHKFVLSMRSAVFETMFYGPLREKGDTVTIEDIEPEVMKIVLKYIYSDNPNIDENNVSDCLYAAKKYDLPGFVKQCSDFIENKLDVSNVIAAKYHAAMYDIKDLEEKCLQFIIENATGVLSSSDFIQSSHETMLNILKQEELKSDEIEIFKAAMKWAEHKCKAESVSVDGENMRNQLGEALFEIRFPTMPISEFASVVSPAEILTKDERLMLYDYIASNRSTSLEKFRYQERSEETITIDLTNQMKGKYDSNICRLSIQTAFSEQQSGRKCIKIRSITGTDKFVQNVNEISVWGAKTADYEIEENRLIFKNPVDLSNDLLVDFHLDNPEFPSSLSYNMNRKESIKGQMITVNKIPAGLETITFI